MLGGGGGGAGTGGVCTCVPALLCVCVCFHIIPYVNCFGRTVLYVCIEYCRTVNMYHVNAQGVDN